MSTAGAGLVERLHGVDEELGARLRVRLAEVEAALRRAVECRDPFLAEAAGHLIRAAGVPPARIEALTCYAEAFGIAFQLSDDVLDITADSARTGKEAGIDLRQGVATMPVLHALSGGGPIAAQIRTVLGGGSTPGL